VVFRGVHPGVGAIVGVNEPERALKKGLPSGEAERIWQARLAKLTERAHVYEHMFEPAGRAPRILLGNCLSAIYAPLFRAMYDYGVLQRLAGTEAVLSVAMSRHFGTAWNPYWQALDSNTLDFRQMTGEALKQTVEALTLELDNVDDPLVASACHELSILLSIYMSGTGAESTGGRWKRRISTGLHYLRHDPRQLSVLVKSMIRRGRNRPVAQSPVARDEAARMSMIPTAVRSSRTSPVCSAQTLEYSSASTRSRCVKPASTKTARTRFAQSTRCRVASCTGPSDLRPFPMRMR
jgi:hypothetical protein